MSHILNARPLRALFASLLLVLTIPALAFASPSALNGSGTSDDPYQIATADDLRTLASEIGSSGTNFSYVLMNDIAFDATQENGYTPPQAHLRAPSTGTVTQSAA